MLRPGNAGSNTVADHIRVLAAAIAQLPARLRSRLLVRVDGAGASHDLAPRQNQPLPAASPASMKITK